MERKKLRLIYVRGWGKQGQNGLVREDKTENKADTLSEQSMYLLLTLSKKVEKFPIVNYT